MDMREPLLLEPPDSLDVYEDLDRVRITLGPARPSSIPGLLAMVALTASIGLVIGHWVAGPGPALAVSVLAASTYRVRRWRRHETPLRLTLERGQVRLTRTFRRKVQYERVLSLHEVRGCTCDARGLSLHITDRVIRLETFFRSEEELRWTAALVASAATAAQESAPGDPAALEALAVVTQRA